MEEKRQLNAWFEEYCQQTQDKPRDTVCAENWRAIWESRFSGKLGKRCPDELTESFAVDLWEETEAKLFSRSELFSAFLLLRSLFSYISDATGAKMPELVLPRAFLTADSALTEEGRYLLNEIVLSYRARISLCFWIALHSTLSFAQILQLRHKDFCVKESELTLTVFDGPRRSGKKETVSIPLDDRDAEMLARQTADFADFPANPAFDAQNKESRERLGAALSKFCILCGLPALTLADLENAAPVQSIPQAKEGTQCSARMKELAESLEAQTAKLPKPVLEHFRRTRYIASYFTEHLRGEDWFIDYGYEELDLLFAVYYHDIGKATLKIEDCFLTGRATAEQRERYRAHVENAEPILAKLFDALPDTPTAEMPEVALREAVLDHHERIDGKGFPNGKKGEEISFAGRLAALADALDHRLFLDAPGANVYEVIDALQEEADAFDKRLLQLLSQTAPVFADFIEELRNLHQKKRAEDAFGIKYTFRPFLSPKTKEIVALEAHLYFNDRYYGVLDSDAVLPMVEKHKDFLAFTKLQVKRLLRTVFTAEENGMVLPPVFVKIGFPPTASQTFFADLLNYTSHFHTGYRKIIFMIDESELIGNEADVATVCEKFHLVGAGFAISGFGEGATLLPSLHRIHPDCLVFHQNYANTDTPQREEFLRSAVASAKKQNIQTYMPMVETQSAFTALSDMGVAGIGGVFAGTDFSEEEIVSH